MADPNYLLVMAIAYLRLANLELLGQQTDVHDWYKYRLEYGTSGFNKMYTDCHEDHMRQIIFTATKHMIEKHNSDPSQTYTMGLNQFSDIIPPELPRGLPIRQDPFAELKKTQGGGAFVDQLRAVNDQTLYSQLNWCKTTDPSPDTGGACAGCLAFVSVSELDSQLREKAPYLSQVLGDGAWLKEHFETADREQEAANLAEREAEKPRRLGKKANKKRKWKNMLCPDCAPLSAFRRNSRRTLLVKPLDSE